MKDPEIRVILKQTELLKYAGIADVLIVEEMGLPVAGARVDIAVIGTKMQGYEIKSASDTLSRLPNQLKAYSLVFDYLTIVTEPKYVNKILAIIPEWVGVIAVEELEGKGFVTEIKPCLLNPNKKGFHIAKLLWKDELIEVLSDHSIECSRYNRCWTMCEMLESNLTIGDLTKAVIGRLKMRTNWLAV